MNKKLFWLIFTIVVCMIVNITCHFNVAFATELKEETNYRFISEFGMANTLAFEGLSMTIPKSAIGAPAVAVKEKNPWIALGLSVLVPGLGQFYNGQPVKGSIQFGLVVGGYTMFLLAVDDDIVYADGTVLDVNDDDAIGGLGILVAGGAVIWSIIDAPISANNINKRNQMQAHLNHKTGYTISPLVKRNKLGATFALQF